MVDIYIDSYLAHPDGYLCDIARISHPTDPCCITKWCLYPGRGQVLRSHQYPTDYLGERIIRKSFGTKTFSHVYSISVNVPTQSKISVGLTKCN